MPQTWLQCAPIKNGLVILMAGCMCWLVPLGTSGPVEEGAVSNLGHGLGESRHTLCSNLWVVRIKHVNDRKIVKARLENSIVTKDQIL